MTSQVPTAPARAAADPPAVVHTPSFLLRCSAAPHVAWVPQPPHQPPTTNHQPPTTRRRVGRADVPLRRGPGHVAAGRARARRRGAPHEPDGAQHAVRPARRGPPRGGGSVLQGVEAQGRAKQRRAGRAKQRRGGREQPVLLALAAHEAIHAQGRALRQFRRRRWRRQRQRRGCLIWGQLHATTALAGQLIRQLVFIAPRVAISIAFALRIALPFALADGPRIVSGRKPAGDSVRGLCPEVTGSRLCCRCARAPAAAAAAAATGGSVEHAAGTEFDAGPAGNGAG